MWNFIKVILLFLAVSKTWATTITPPHLVFEYGIVQDYKCRGITEGANVTASHENIMIEARNITRRLQAQWNKEGVDILSTLVNIVGREYSLNTLTVYTSACGYGSQSSPLIVSVRKHLVSVGNNDANISSNITLVLHEFIHRYLSESFDYGKSSVLTEFSDYPSIFKNHLHVMALIKRTLIQAGREDLVQQYANSLKGKKAYMRAWKFGTSKKYYLRLINEVQTLEGNNENYWFFDPIKKS